MTIDGQVPIMKLMGGRQLTNPEIETVGDLLGLTEATEYEITATIHGLGFNWTDASTYNFTHTETLEIAGISNDTLMTWFKRTQLPESWFQYSPGRGNRRRYNIYQVILLAVTKVALEAGFPTMSDATVFSVDVGRRILSGIRRLGGYTPDQAKEQMKNPLVRGDLFDFGVRVPWNPKSVAAGVALPPISVEAVGSIPYTNWRDSREWITLLDEAVIAERIIDRAVAVVRRRKG